MGRQGGAVSPFRTRRGPIPGGSDETSLFHTVLQRDTAPPRLRRTQPENPKHFGFGHLNGQGVSGDEAEVSSRDRERQDVATEPTGKYSWRVRGRHTRSGITHRPKLEIIEFDPVKKAARSYRPFYFCSGRNVFQSTLPMASFCITPRKCSLPGPNA